MHNTTTTEYRTVVIGGGLAHISAVIGENTYVGKGAVVGKNAYVGEDAVIGENAEIGKGAYVTENA